MKIEIQKFDTTVISLLLISTVLPIIFSKIMVSICFAIILARIFLSKDFLKYYNSKILILILFLPVLISSYLYDLKETIRYLVILMIVLGLPYASFRLNYLLIYKVSALCLFYLVVTQILLIFEVELISNLRDYGYQTEWSYVFLSYGRIDNLTLNVLLDDNFRAAGLFYNPNILAGLIFLYFILLDTIYKNILIKINNSQNNKSFINLYNIVLFIAILGIFLTKSRTVILALLVYIYFVNFHFKSFSYLKIIKSFIFYALLFIIILFLEGDRIIDGIVNENESFNSKYNIFIGYIKNEVSILNLVGGGVFDKQFDTEYGKLFGSAGIMGCIGYYFFFNLLIKCNLSMKPIIFSFLIMSFGTTVLLSLLKIAIILPIIITIISFENNKKFKL